MLQLTIHLSPEGWDEQKQEFVEPKVCILRLEHSLVSLSKWESKWCKPFLSTKDLSYEETLDYIKFMTLTQNVKPEVYSRITTEHVRQIREYIGAPMTATTFREMPNSKPNREIVTAELIYHWMIELNIPFECQKWHLNRLITLIKVRNIKLQPPKKANKRQTMANYAAINEARKKHLNSKG